MTARPVTEHGVHRILALVPWIVANPGVTVGEIAQRFGVSAEQVRSDLDIVLMVGVPPYTPDTYIDVLVDDEGHVDLNLGDFFLRPPRLSPAEGIALLAAGRALLAVPGSEPAGPLASALGKLEQALDMPDLVVDVGEPEFLGAVRAAADRAARIEIDYWSASRDARTTRTIDPYSVFYADGEWYVSAYCHLRDDQRAFRIDRVRAVRETGETFDATEAGSIPAIVFEPHRDDLRARVELEPSAAWVAEVYPVEEVTEIEGGRLSVVLAVSQVPWLERLLLRLGPDASLVEPESLRDLAARAARRVLGRYGNN